MDIGLYLGELLMQEGEVSVPGLGYFVQARMSGYYDEGEGKFYPPYLQVKFDLQSIDDDLLAQHVAHKKKISLASSKYFIEKYIAALKQEALIGEVVFGNIGWFYTDRAQLTFRPSNKIIDNSVFYGYSPVKITKIRASVEPEAGPAVKPQPVYTQQPEPVSEPEPIIAEQPEPVLTETPEPVSIQQPVIAPETEEPEEQQENVSGYNEEILESEEDEETRNPLRAVFITLIAIAVIGVTILALYTYAPTTFNRLLFWKSKTEVAPIDNKSEIEELTKRDPVINTDTAQKALIDTTPKVVAPVADTTIKTRFEIIAVSCKTMEEANKIINNFKTIGVDAHVIPDAAGPLKKITVGTYQTAAQAGAAMAELKAAKKIRQKAFVQKYKTEQ